MVSEAVCKLFTKMVDMFLTLPSQIRKAYKICMTAAVRQSLLVRDELDHSGSDSELDDLDKSLGFEEFRLIQHRHYLSFEGVGTGNPAEREKAFRQKRLDKALENVFQRKYNQALANEEEVAVGLHDLERMKKRPWDRRHKRSRGTLEGIADEMIREAAMGRGEFDNLKGMGKPLDHLSEVNHHTDTYRLNKVLAYSGYVPDHNNYLLFVYLFVFLCTV